MSKVVPYLELGGGYRRDVFGGIGPEWTGSRSGDLSSPRGGWGERVFFEGHFTPTRDGESLYCYISRVNLAQLLVAGLFITKCTQTCHVYTATWLASRNGAPGTASRPSVLRRVCRSCSWVSWSADWPTAKEFIRLDTAVSVRTGTAVWTCMYTHVSERPKVRLLLR